MDLSLHHMHEYLYPEVMHVAGRKTQACPSLTSQLVTVSWLAGEDGQDMLPQIAYERSPIEGLLIIVEWWIVYSSSLFQILSHMPNAIPSRWIESGS